MVLPTVVSTDFAELDMVVENEKGDETYWLIQHSNCPTT